MILNRLTSLLFLVVAILASNANAQLVVEVEGVPGSGVTTWTFSGESNVLPDCIRDVILCEVRDVTNNTFSTFDSGQFPFGEDTILDTTSGHCFPTHWKRIDNCRRHNATHRRNLHR